MGLEIMKRNSLSLSILVICLSFMAMLIGCGGKLKDAEEHYDIGTIHWKQGRIDDAIEEYKRAISIFSQS